MRDVMKDPRVGDQIRGVWRQPSLHVGNCPLLEVMAVVGNLIALMSSQTQPILWIPKESWPPPVDGWILGYIVIRQVED